MFYKKSAEVIVVRNEPLLRIKWVEGGGLTRKTKD
jgi:hypothetical protein